MRRRLLPFSISLAGVLLIALLIYGISHQAASRSLDTQLAEGHQPLAPSASTTMPLLGAAGRSSLASLRGKVVLLNFWASWCEPCRVEAPLLQHSEQALEAHNGTVLGITYKDATPDSEGFVGRYHLTYSNLTDGSGDFAAAYGTDQLPESFIINRQGRIIAISRGEIGQPFIEKALALARTT